MIQPLQSPPARAELPGFGLPTTLLRLTLTPEHAWTPGPDLNTTLRGALGLAYRAMRCPSPKLACGDCGIRATCLVPTWYNPGGLRPFALRVFGGSHIDQSQPLVMELSLFGPVPAPEQLLNALRDMAHRGLGKQRVPHRLRYLVLQGATRSEGPGWELTWPTPAPLETLVQGEPFGERVQVTLLTPLQLSQSADTLNAQLFWSTVRNRLRNLQRVYGQRTLALLPERPELEIVSSDLRESKRSRHSRRQGQRVPLGGLLGSFVLQGELSEVTLALRAAKLTQIGKATSTGLGQLLIEAVKTT